MKTIVHNVFDLGRHSFQQENWGNLTGNMENVCEASNRSLGASEAENTRPADLRLALFGLTGGYVRVDDHSHGAASERTSRRRIRRHLPIEME